MAPLDAVPAFRKAAVLSANAEHEQAMDGCSCGKAVAPLDAVPAFRKAAVLSANAEHEQAMDGCSCGKAGGGVSDTRHT